MSSFSQITWHSFNKINIPCFTFYSCSRLFLQLFKIGKIYITNRLQISLLNEICKPCLLINTICIRVNNKNIQGNIFLRNLLRLITTSGYKTIKSKLKKCKQVEKEGVQLLVILR